MRIIITERQENLLTENRPTLPIAFRRRLSSGDSIKNHLDYGVLEYLNPCEWTDIGEFIGDVCNTVVDELVDYHHQDTGDRFSSIEKDDLYIFCVDTYGDYIKTFYKQRCV